MLIMEISCLFKQINKQNYKKKCCFLHWLILMIICVYLFLTKAREKYLTKISGLALRNSP